MLTAQAAPKRQKSEGNKLLNRVAKSNDAEVDRLAMGTMRGEQVLYCHLASLDMRRPAAFKPLLLAAPADFRDAVSASPHVR
jgi:hypothetical protein